MPPGVPLPELLTLNQRFRWERAFARQASRQAVMHTVQTAVFPGSVFKAQGILQMADEHPRDIPHFYCSPDWLV